MIIYRVTNKKTGATYIGQTIRSLEVRKAEHLRSAQRLTLQKYPTPLHKAIREFGSGEFEWDVLEEHPNNENLNLREKFYIKLLNTMVPNGYNQTTGGHMDSTTSEEIRDKIAESVSKLHLDPSYREKVYPKLKGLVPPNKGVPMSEEQKLKVGKARKAAYDVPNYVNPNVGQKREGQALKNLHRSYKTRKLPKAEEWLKAHSNQYTEEVRIKMRAAKIGKKPANTKLVKCIETNQIFNGLTEASVALNVNRQSIYMQIKGKLKSAGGYHFIYVDKE